jgi:hypothetical protein
MGLLDYLKSWNPKGGDDEGENSDYGVPLRHDMPETPEWGYGDDKIGAGGYGHSSDCEDKGQRGSTWGMSSGDVERGYERGESDGEGSALLGPRQAGGSYPASIPSSNPWDRTYPYSDEPGRSNTGAYDGRGQPESTSNPGGETIGSSKLPY